MPVIAVEEILGINFKEMTQRIDKGNVVVLSVLFNQFKRIKVCMEFVLFKSPWFPSMVPLVCTRGFRLLITLIVVVKSFD